MKRRKLSVLEKILIACFAAATLGVVLGSATLFWLMAEAHKTGTEIQAWKAVFVACLPGCMAIIYSIWMFLAHSPESIQAVRTWLSDGWLSKANADDRLLNAFDRFVGWIKDVQSRVDAAKAIVVQHNGWKWGTKPIGIGLLAAVAVSPLLFVAPWVGGDYGMRITFAGAWTAGLVIWAVATLAYLAARLLGVLDANDHTRTMRMASRNERRQVSDLFQDGIVPMAMSAASRGGSGSAGDRDLNHASARMGWVDAESSMRDFEHPQIGPPPDGFEWKFFRNAVFIQPENWHVIVQEMPPVADGVGMDVYATSPRPFSSSNPFETGFTVQVMSGMKSGRWQSARHAYATYIKPFFDRIGKDDFLLLDEKEHGQLRLFFLRYRDAAQGLPSVIVHKFIVVNDALEHVHVFTFESPEASWPEQWARYGEMVLGSIGIVRPSDA